jgi:hypothetical protein
MTEDPTRDLETNEILRALVADVRALASGMREM